MSATDQDVSDSSRSPFSQTDSPYSSPSQQVPQLASFISELSCAENPIYRDNKPHLVIIEQPTNQFRFRYKSEMIGTHGCLLGKSYSMSKTKTHPTVELRNFGGKATVRCRLARHDTPDEHPHMLEDDQERDVSYILPESGTYRVAFKGMGIIHTAKKDVAGLLYTKYAQEKHDTPFDENKLRFKCEHEARSINLNIVRLKFSAYDLLTNEEICPPVFSEPIHNMKSAATNDLKICRISRCTGRPKGGDDVFILVEKVNKKNIMIRFFELGENGERTWTATGNFLQSDVHHQYAIVFRTPEYKNAMITSDVEVFIELVRPSDGKTSEPTPFTYKAETIYKQNKKRKANSYSSLESTGSIKSLSEIPATIEFIQQNGNLNDMHDEVPKGMPMMYTFKFPQTDQVLTTPDSIMADAILDDLGYSPTEAQADLSPMLSQPNVPPPPVLQMNSSDMDRILEQRIEVTEEEKAQFFQANLSDYFKHFNDSLPSEMNEPGAMDFIKSAMLVSDSGRPKQPEEVSPKELIKKSSGEYSAYYKSEDGLEVKKLVKELCEMIRTKTAYKKQVVRSKLERLFDMRLSNGDTFLHMTLCSNQPSLEYIVKIIHSVKMTKLLNLRNNQNETILHLAVMNDSPKLVKLLVSKGCDPMLEDRKGNNAVHNAVIGQTCLGALLEAITMYNVNFNIDAQNNEKQTALHLAVIYESAESVDLLTRYGASHGARDSYERTALHLAAYDDCLTVTKALLKTMPENEIDALDAKGYTALQIVCEGPMRQNTLEIVKLLLEKKADPTKHESNNHPVWKLVRGKPALEDLLKKQCDLKMYFDDDVKSEPEDDFESADEGEEYEDCLREMPLYIDEVSAILDREEAWKELANRLRKDALYSWYKATVSPTKTLLTHVKECNENLSSKSLALLLSDMGHHDAACVIRRYISD